MAMYDILGELADNQDFSLTTTETIVSEDVLNLGIDDINWGNGEIWLNIKVSLLFVSSGTPSTIITLRASSDDTVTASDTAVITIPAQDLTGLSLGADVYRGRVPIDVDQEQTLGVVAVNTSGEYSQGKLDIWFDHGSQSDFATQQALSNIT